MRRIGLMGQMGLMVQICATALSRETHMSYYRPLHRFWTRGAKHGFAVTKRKHGLRTPKELSAISKCNADIYRPQCPILSISSICTLTLLGALGGLPVLFHFFYA